MDRSLLVLPGFFGNVFENVLDRSYAISAVRLPHRYVAIAAEGHFIERRGDRVGLV